MKTRKQTIKKAGKTKYRNCICSHKYRLDDFNTMKSIKIISIGNVGENKPAIYEAY